MKNQKNNIKRLCSFYVSDWHLTTMIFPFINKKLSIGEKVDTIFQINIESNIKLLLNKLNLNNDLKNKINLINWKNNYLNNYSDLNNYLNNIIEKNKNININIFINGTNDYINQINNNLNIWINENNNLLTGKNIFLNIINCFEVNEFNNINNILNKHDKVLNTSGEKEINEVFSNQL